MSCSSLLFRFLHSRANARRQHSARSRLGYWDFLGGWRRVADCATRAQKAAHDPDRFEDGNPSWVKGHAAFLGAVERTAAQSRGTDKVDA